MNPNNKSFLKRRWLLLAGVILLFALFTGLFYAYKNYIHSNKDNTDNKVLSDGNSKQTLLDRATSISQSKGAKDAQDYLNEQLNKADTTSAKVDIYIAKSVVANMSIDSTIQKTALDYATSAYNLDETSETSLNLAAIEESQGDITKAIYYYHRYLSLVPKDSNGKPTDEDYYYYQNYSNDLEAGKL